MIRRRQPAGFDALRVLGVCADFARRYFTLTEKQASRLILSGYCIKQKEWMAAINPCYPFVEFFARHKPRRVRATTFHLWTISPAGPIGTTGWWTNGAILLPNTDVDLGSRGPAVSVQSLALPTFPPTCPQGLFQVDKFRVVFQPEIFWHPLAKPILPPGRRNQAVFVNVNYIDYCRTRNPQAKFFVDPVSNALFADVSPLPGPIRIGGVCLPKASRAYISWMEKKFYGENPEFPNIRRRRDR